MWYSSGFIINKRLVRIIMNVDKSAKSNEDRRMHIRTMRIDKYKHENLRLFNKPISATVINYIAWKCRIPR